MISARWKSAVAVLAAIAVVTTLALAAVGWYYAGMLRSDALAPDHSPDRLDVVVGAVDSGRVTLLRNQAGKDGTWQQEGTFGLEWEGGYGQLGPIRERGNGRVVRDFTTIEGGIPPVGAAARVDSFAFPGDPRQAFGIDFQEVMVRSPMGDFPAWSVDGTRKTSIIFVHGRKVTRREALRMLPVVHQQGFPALVITYRNDEGLPADPSGYYRYGLTEWRDLEAAAQFALDRGASDLVLVGYSMGGGIVANFLSRSDLAPRVRGVVLDAPMLDFGATIDFGAERKGVPGIVTTIGNQMAAWRFDVDWGALDYIDRAGDWQAPLLLFHGDKDDTVPITVSDRLARARPDLVTYVRTRGAGHVKAWNADPVAYEAAVAAFLARVAGD